MKEDKLLDNLWEAAREENPQASYEEVAKKFQAALPIAAGAGGMAWFGKYLSLNNIVLVSSLSLVTLATWWSLSSHSNTSSNRVNPLPVKNEEIIPPVALDTVEQSNPLISSDTLRSPEIQDQQVPEIKEALVPAQYPDTPSQELVLLEEEILAEQTPPRQELKIDSHAVLEPESGELPKLPKVELDHTLPKWTHYQSDFTFVITKNDGEAKVQELFKQLWDWGFLLHTKSKYRFHKSQLSYLFLWLKHENGLDFKLKGEGFERLELHVRLGSQGLVETFSYRFNQEEFTKDIPLNCVGYKTYSYGPGFRGMSGKTSINIEN